MTKIMMKRFYEYAVVVEENKREGKRDYCKWENKWLHN